MVLTVRHSSEVCLFYDCQWSLQCPSIRVEGQSEAKQLVRKRNLHTSGPLWSVRFQLMQSPSLQWWSMPDPVDESFIDYLSSCLNAREESHLLGVDWWSLCVLSVRT